MYAGGTNIAPCESLKEDPTLDAEQIAYIMDCVKKTNNNELLKALTLDTKTGDFSVILTNPDKVEYKISCLYDDVDGAPSLYLYGDFLRINTLNGHLYIVDKNADGTMENISIDEDNINRDKDILEG